MSKNNKNNTKGDDCLSQSDEVESSFSLLELTEDQLLASPHEGMETDPPSEPSKSERNNNILNPEDEAQSSEIASDVDMDDDDGDGINVTIKLSVPPPSNEGLDTNSGRTEDGKKTPNPNKLTRAQRKKLKALRQTGVSRPEALSKIHGKEKTVSTSSKRPRQDLDKSATAEENPNQKRTKHHLDPRERVGQSTAGGSSRRSNQTLPQPGNTTKRTTEQSYSDMASRSRVGIIPKDYPTTQLSTAQLDVLQEALLLRVEQQRNETVKPKFCNLIYRSGHMVLICKDRGTAEWVKEITPTLNAVESVELVAMDEEKIQRPELIRAFFPLSAKYCDDRIKALIESQNDLKTTNWRVLKRSILNKLHVEWTFTVDGPSMDMLHKSKFILDYRFGEIQLRKIKNIQPNSDKTPPERLAQEKSEEAPGHTQHNSALQTSSSTSDGKDPSSIPSSSGTNSMVPNMIGGSEYTDLTREGKQAGLGGSTPHNPVILSERPITKGKAPRSRSKGVCLTSKRGQSAEGGRSNTNKSLTQHPNKKSDGSPHPTMDGKRPGNGDQTKNV